MITEVDRYHGLAIRRLIAQSDAPLTIEKCDKQGRLNSYLLNGKIAVHIKHSTKRLPPWGFSFTLDHLRELSTLKKTFASTWLLFVCGSHGLVSITLDEFVSVTGARPGGVASLRIDRGRGTMYRVHGNDGQLQSAKPNSVQPILGQLASELQVLEAADA